MHYNLRTNLHNLVEVPHHNLQIYLNCYSSVSPRIFNSLPEDIRLIRIKALILKRVKSCLFNLNYVDLDRILYVMQ